MWGLHVDFIIHEGGCALQCERYICLEAYANNVKSKYTSACGDIVDYIDFI